MAKHTLVLDTNVIIDSKFSFIGPSWRLVFALAQMGAVRLVVPEVVVREAVGRHREHTGAARKKLDRIGVDVGFLDDEIANYESKLRSALEVAEVPSEPNCSIMDLVDRAVNRVPPFNSNGNGFRDAVVWAHVCEAARRHGAATLLTGDSGFLEGGSPTRLKKELNDETDGAVNVFKTVDEWLRTIELGDSPSNTQALAAEKMVERADDLMLLIAEGLKSAPIALGDSGRRYAVAAQVDVVSPVTLAKLKHTEGESDLHLALFRVFASFTIRDRSDGEEEPRNWTTDKIEVTGTMLFDAAEQTFGTPEFEVIEVANPPWAVSISQETLSALSSIQFDTTGIADVLSSVSTTSLLGDAHFDGIRSLANSLPSIADQPVFRSKLFEKLGNEQFAVAEIANQAVGESIRQIAALSENLQAHYRAAFSALDVGADDEQQE